MCEASRDRVTSVVPESEPERPSMSGRTVSLLQQTQPWTMFIGILTLVLAGLCVLGFVGLLASNEMGGALMATLYAIFYLAIGISCIRYGSRIRDFATLQTQELLDNALDAQLVYWRIVGITAMSGVAFIVLITLVAALGHITTG